MFDTKTLQEGWKSYKTTLPEDACETQISETRAAFYAGATYCFNLTNLISNEAESEEAAGKMFDGIVEEIQDFRKNIK